MDTWTLLIGGAIGLALALFGVRMLITGRAPASTARSFRTVHDAGLYHLLFGLGLLLLVGGHPAARRPDQHRDRGGGRDAGRRRGGPLPAAGQERGRAAKKEVQDGAGE